MWSSHSQAFIFRVISIFFHFARFFLWANKLNRLSFSKFRNFRSHESRGKTNKLEVCEMRSRDIDLITKLCTLTWSESLKRQTWTLETKRCWTIKHVSATSHCCLASFRRARWFLWMSDFDIFPPSPSLPESNSLSAFLPPTRSVSLSV